MTEPDYAAWVDKLREVYPDLLPWDEEWPVRRGNYLTLVSPSIAEELLARNTNNRRPNKRKIEQYRRDMLAGRWDGDASDLKLSRTGELVDGQNRCMACIEAGVPFPTLIRTGLGLGTKAHVDTGKARTGSDVLRMMRGVTNYAAGIAAAVALRNRYTERVEKFDRQRGLDWKATALTHEETMAFLDAHPMIEEFAAMGQSLYANVTPAIPVSVWIAGLSMMAEVDHAAARDVGERLLTGEFGGPGDPLQALVGYAARIRSQIQPGAGLGGIRGRIAQEESLMALLKTWNAIRSGSEIRRLSVRRDERLPLPE